MLAAYHGPVFSICFIYYHFRSAYPSSDFHCISDYLRFARPEFDDIRYIFVPDTYDGYVERGLNNTSMSRSFIQPDVVAVLNCGFIFYDSWDKSIPYLLKYPEIPLVFTEYYQHDCELNLQKVDSIGI